MFSIKNSFADCMSCPLLDAPSCILETNCSDNLKDIEVVFVSENPGKNEVKKKRPLIGRAGRTFRKPFDLYIRDKFKWLLTNCVLCCTLLPDGKTGNPTPEIIERCKENAFNIIEACSPKLIVAMGASPMSAFGFAKTGITDLRGQVFKWRDYDVLLTVHPSFVNRNQSYKGKFERDIQTAAVMLGAELEVKAEKGMNAVGTGKYRYKIPEEFYSPDYRLVDVQFLHKTNEVIHIFRDKDNNKIYHKENDDYFCYRVPEGIENKHLVEYDKLEIIKVPYKQKSALDPERTYEGDIRISVKYAQDYYHFSKGEPSEKELNIMFLDIETYSKTKEFPNVEDADHPICLITYYYHGKYITYVVDNKILLNDRNAPDIITTKEDPIHIFKSEREMILKFIKDLRTLEPDFLVGWNVIGFDLYYIYNRCRKLRIKQESLSKFNEVSFSIDEKRQYCEIAGLVVLDLLRLYRSFTFTQKENYRLGTIAQEELGEEKTDVGENFSEKYEKDINGAIDYNIKDVELILRIDNKLRLIVLENEIRKIGSSSFAGAFSNLGKLDSLVISFLKDKGFASRNANVHKVKEASIPGAFVKEPRTGIHEYIVDFDFTSLYPSLILTYNIGINTFVAKFKDHTLGYDFVYQLDNLPEEFTIIYDPGFLNKEMTVKKEDFIKKVKDANLTYTINGCFYKPHDKEVSVYSEVLDHLLISRKEYKDKMFDAKQAGEDHLHDMYYGRQLVYKVLANALYGILTNHFFRFYHDDLGSSITLSGQEALKTSIIHGNNYVDMIKKKASKYEAPEPLTKQEMYGDVTRDTEFIITGDTDSLFVSFDDIVDKNKSEDELMKQIESWCDEIQLFLNNKIIMPLVTNHNVPLERNRLELKNELVIKRGLFLAKKHYAIYVTSQEGRKTDEIVNMGIATKRSDYPSYTKQSLSDLLDLILKSEEVSLKKIMDFIHSRKTSFIHKIRAGDKRVARPSAFTRRLDHYKKVPPGVISMLNWNELEYKIFDVGSKGYLFKLNGIDLMKAPPDVAEKYNQKFLANGRKLDYISLPDEEISLPSYYVVDVSAMLKFAWEDRFSLILEPVMSPKQELMTI